MLIHNTNIPGVSKNVDFVVFNQFAEAIDKKHLEPILKDYKNYIVMGELKGRHRSCRSRRALENGQSSFRSYPVFF